MKIQVVSIRDRAVDAYQQPFFVHKIGQAIRSFQDAINSNDPQAQALSKHPEDHDLYHLGEFDDETGQFTNLKNGPQQIAIGKDLKQN